MGKFTLGIISANYTSDDLGPLTNDRTVATLPFGGRYRLLDFALSNFVNSNIRTVGLITPYYYRSIMDHVGSGKSWDLAKKRGGLFILPGTVFGDKHVRSRILLKDIIRNGKILDRSSSQYVMFCDSSVVMNCDLEEFIDAHVASGCPISLMYKKEVGHKDRSYLKIKRNGRVEKIYHESDKLENLFMGYYIINRDLLMNLIDWYQALDNYDLFEIIAENLGKYEVNTFEFKGYAAIIDTIADYKKASRDLLDHKVRIELFGQERQIYTKVQDEAPTIFRPGSSVKKSLIAAGCVIEGKVENSIIFRAATVKKGAVVKDSIIMQQTTIESDATVINAICDKYVHVGRKTHIEGGKNNPVVLGKNQTV